MKRTQVLTLLVAALLGVFAFGASQSAMAELTKPMATISFSGHDAVISDIDYLGKLGDNPDLAMVAEGFLAAATQGKGLDGLDKARPWGVALFPNPTDPTEEPTVVLFIPVTDAKKLLAVLNEAGMETKDGADGAVQIVLPDAPMELHAKQIGTWAFVTNKKDYLGDMPADPLAWLGGTEAKYDIALRVIVQNIPGTLRETFVQQLEFLLQMAAMQSPNQAAAAQMQQVVAQIKRMANELDAVTVGAAINDASGKTYLDVEVTAVSGTETAQDFARVKPAPSRMSGFYVPEATVVIQSVATMSKDEIARAVESVKSAHGQFVEELANQDLPEEQLSKVKKVIGDLVNIATKTIEGGKTDLGASLWLDADKAAVVVGSLIVDGKELEATLKEMVELAVAETPELASMIQLNAAEFEGISLHTFTMPVPPVDERETVVELIGETVEAVVGTSEDAVYVAIGRDAMAKLKAAISGSKSSAGENVLPSRMSLAVTPLVRFIGKVVPNEEAKFQMEMVAGMLEQAGSENHVLMTVEPVANGMRQRIEIEQGILKMLGTMSKMATQGMSPMP
ncbi:MAG: hypothetical protein GX621_01660 [Pirellulaceae bacterium]|nr:hypothetical protein [Pirellulaceae bacterium]